MRILQIGKYYPPYKGGMETVLRDLCEGLLDQGHILRVLVSGTETKDRLETIRGTNSRPVGKLIRCARFGTFSSQPLTTTLFSHLRRALIEFKPDIILIHLPNPLATALLLLLRAQIPDATLLTAWYHADIARQRLGRPRVGPIVNRLLGICDGIAVSSAELIHHSDSLNMADHRLRVIPFGVLPERWQSATQTLVATAPFLFIGRLVYYKGLRTLLYAMQHLPSARLDIVGSGPLEPQILETISALGLGDRIRLLGEVADEELVDLMASSRALVMPSDRSSETFGLVQLEAMVSGLPVISCTLPTGVSGINRNRETGLQIVPGDVEALRAAMAEILADPVQAVAWGRAGRQRVIENYHRDTMVGSLVEWFEELSRIVQTTRNLAHGF